MMKESKNEASTSQADADEDLLAALGYKQELRRYFSPLQTFMLAFSLVGIVSSFSTVLIFSIPYGGPVTMIWGWTAAAGFLLMIALALAELASAAPTSGGLYYWTFSFSSDKYRCFLAWIVGYANTISNVASVASIEWGCAVQIMAAASIGSEGFEASNAQLFGVPKFIATLQPYFTALNVVLCFVVIVLLPALTTQDLRNTADFAFGHFENSINVALCFTMGNDVGAIVDSPIGQPLATILLRSFGQKGALAAWSFIVLAQFAIGTGQLTACSRQIFAFTRDGALPFSAWVYRVDERTRAPIRSVWFSAFLTMLLGLITFAGANAINAVFALVITGQYTAYAIPVAARWMGGKDFKPGPVNFGAWSLPITVVAVTWMVFMSIIAMFPANPNPAVDSMNYTVVVQVGVLVLATLYYFFPKYGGRYWFKGPISNIEHTTSTPEKAVVPEDPPVDKY
ncbi:hypothetical protein V5O48_004446 [Marasmius crinis-equi]|uniref:Amino acid transporter n=1 Tax=Marasmius crinis-equi TaxID=585013 RepID=A0ABR3FQT3_9AGAR